MLERLLLVLAFISGTDGCANTVSIDNANDNRGSLTQGVLAAETSSDSVVIWARGQQRSTMTVRLYEQKHRAQSDNHAVLSRTVDSEQDFTGQIKFTGLKANTVYFYDVSMIPLTTHSRSKTNGAAQQSASKQRHDVMTGTFKTAPLRASLSAVRLAWTGDFGGQNVCRDVLDGYPIFRPIQQDRVDAFIALGDMIYADDLCHQEGRYGNRQVKGDFSVAKDLHGFWAHWRYNRTDSHSKTLFASTNYYGIWDDHEVINDFGPQLNHESSLATQKLISTGLRAFLDYTPISVNQPGRLYRTVRWGQHAELFFLDTRQYRDANLAPDSKEQPKTMLGSAQLQWLLEQLRTSDATWKIIVSSVPISIPTGYPLAQGRDGWANHDENTALTSTGISQASTGFEFELYQILKSLERYNTNALFITTDVHFAEVFRYQPFEQDGSDYTVHEVVVGPGNAGIFPNRAFDKTFGSESLFFYGPETTSDVKSWEQAKRWFNYGLIEISEDGALTTAVKGMNGVSLFELELSPKETP